MVIRRSGSKRSRPAALYQPKHRDVPEKIRLPHTSLDQLDELDWSVIAATNFSDPVI